MEALDKTDGLWWIDNNGTGRPRIRPITGAAGQVARNLPAEWVVAEVAVRGPSSTACRHNFGSAVRLLARRVDRRVAATPGYQLAHGRSGSSETAQSRRSDAADCDARASRWTR